MSQGDVSLGRCFSLVGKLDDLFENGKLLGGHVGDLFRIVGTSRVNFHDLPRNHVAKRVIAINQTERTQGERKARLSLSTSPGLILLSPKSRFIGMPAQPHPYATAPLSPSENTRHRKTNSNAG